MLYNQNSLMMRSDSRLAVCTNKQRQPPQQLLVSLRATQSHQQGLHAGARATWFQCTPPMVALLSTICIAGKANSTASSYRVTPAGENVSQLHRHIRGGMYPLLCMQGCSCWLSENNKHPSQIDVHASREQMKALPSSAGYAALEQTLLEAVVAAAC